MKVTEQIDAMEVAAINPFKYLVVTRILATTLMVPLLVIFADGVGMLGGFIGINMHGDVSLFATSVFDSLAFIDIIPATIKTFFFGFIGMIGCYKGFNAENGTASVGQAANSAVVTASLTILSLIC
jgi:phospholipid/cholesterol/gamma-HCH transport system permease protein